MSLPPVGPVFTTYRLIRTMGRPYGNASTIDQIDATAVSLLALSQLYYDIYFIVQRTNEGVDRCLFYKDLPLDVQLSNMSIVDYLATQVNKNLQLSVDIPVHRRGEVYAWDAHSWGFDYRSIKQGYHPDVVLPEEDKPDLFLFKPGLNHLEAATYSLISINGLLHYYDYGEAGWLVYGGNTTRRKHPNSTHVNILDFSQVGKIGILPIKKSMMSPLGNNIPYKEGFYIDLTESLEGKTIGVSIGGYLHLLDHTYKQVSDRCIRINFSQIRWESLYYKMKQLIDVSSLPITDFGDDRVIGFELYHDLTIQALMELPQSFIFVIDNPNVTVVEQPVGHMGYPKRYESAIPPIYPLRIGEGRYPAYKAIKDKDKWVLAVEDNIVPLQVRYQKPGDQFHIIHDRLYPINHEVYATANYVRIMSDKDIKVRGLDAFFKNSPRHMGSLRPFMLEMNLDDYAYRKDSGYYFPPKLVDVDLNDDYFKPDTTPF